MSPLARCFSIALIPLAICSASFDQHKSLLDHLSKCQANFTIAGMFAIHRETEASKYTCNHESRKILRSGIYEAMAMIFAVANVNSDNRLLPGVPVSVDISDNCNNINAAVDEYLRMDFVPNVYGDSHNWMNRTSRIFAVIGSTTTAMAKSLSTLSNVFEVPLVSYAATSPVLSDITRFRSFFRTVPSDELLIEAITDLLLKSEWTKISVFYTKTDYAFSAFQLLLGQIKKINLKINNGREPICIVSQDAIDNADNSTELDETLDRVKRENKSNVYLVFAHKAESYKMLMTAFQKQIRGKLWVLSDGVDEDDLKACRDISDRFAETVIMIGFKSGPTARFKEFISNYFSKVKDIVPVSEINWNMTFVNQSTQSESIPGSVTYIIDAVTAVAHALHKTLNCSQTDCKNQEDFRQSDIIKNLLEVNFTSQSGQQMTFNKYGDTEGTYVFRVLDKENSSYAFREIAEWRSSGYRNGFVYYDDSLATTTTSKCDEQCKEGWGRLMLRKRDSCCWSCIKCRGNEYSSRITKKCEQCPEREAPDENNGRCTPLKKQEHRLEFLSFTVFCLSALGLFLTAFVSIIFIVNRNSHIVRASNKEVIAVLIVGVALAYIAPLTEMAERSTVTCRLYLYINGLSIGLMSGALFTKANRMYRIFRKQAMTGGRLRFMDLKWQLLAIGIFVVCEILSSTFLSFNPCTPIQIVEVVSKPRKTVTLVCSNEAKPMLIFFSLHQCLILICTYQAFLARKVPGEYNDSKSMFGVTIAMSLVNGILLIVFYYGELAQINSIAISLPSFFSGTIILSCLFSGKVHKMIFKPDLNAVALPHGQLGTFASPHIPLERLHSEPPGHGVVNRTFDMGDERL